MKSAQNIMFRKGTGFVSSEEKATDNTNRTTVGKTAEASGRTLVVTTDWTNDDHDDKDEQVISSKKQHNHAGRSPDENSTRRAENSLVTDLDDGGVVSSNNIQPLPQQQTSSMGSIPGAHFVMGIGGDGQSSSRRSPACLTISGADEDGTTTALPQQETLIDGAVVVDDDNDGNGDEEGQAAAAHHHDTRATGNDDEVIEGTPLASWSSRREKNAPSRRQLYLPLCVFVLVLGAVVVVITLLLTSSSSNNNNNNNNNTSVANNNNTTTAAETSVLVSYPPFQEGLARELVNGMEEVGSSYYRANLWVWNDPSKDVYTPERRLQRFLMVYFYYQSHGESWFQNDHWLSYSVSECDWFNQNSSDQYGGYNAGESPYPTCDEKNNLLVMNMTANNLTGEMVLSNHGFNPLLHILDLSNNQIYGIPPPLADHASNMEVFSIANNKFTGQLTTLGGFSAWGIRIVQMDGNQLFGSNRAIFRFLPRLEVLNLTNNLYDLPITGELQHCKNLIYLGLQSNLYEGPLPSQLGVLTNLEVLDVSHNPLLNGTIPVEYGNLTNLQLLDISGTGIQGRIPEGLCDADAAATTNDRLELIANCSVVECCS